MHIKRLLPIFCLIMLVFSFLLPLVTQAGFWYPGSKAQNYLEEIGKTGFGTNEPPGEGYFQRTVFSVLKYFLGFLGIVFFVLIVYSGFTWMTASGNEQKVEQARKIMTNATIGLTIVVASYAITSFILGVLIASTK